MQDEEPKSEPLFWPDGVPGNPRLAETERGRAVAVVKGEPLASGGIVSVKTTGVGKELVATAVDCSVVLEQVDWAASSLRNESVLLTQPPRIRANKRMLTGVGWPRQRPAKLCPQGPKETPSIAFLEPSGSMRSLWVWQCYRYVEYWNSKQLEQTDGKEQATNKDECQMSGCKPKDERTVTVGTETEKR